VNPSHGLQLFTDYASVGPFHGVQSFRNRLLQRGSPTGSPALPANLLRHGLLSPWVHRSWQEPAPERAPHRVTASFGHLPALAWGPFHKVQSFRKRLLQCGSPMGAQALPANLLQCGLLSLHGSTGPGRSLLQHGLPMGSQPPSGIHLLRHGVFHSLQVDICSIVNLHGLQGDNLPHHGLHHRLQGKKNFCSSVWSTSSPSFFTDLGVCRVFSLTSSHSSLLTAISLQVCPLLNYAITEALAPSLIGLALVSSRSVLEPAGAGFIRHRGSFSQLLTEATSIAPPLPKPCHTNPKQGCGA